MRVTIFERLRRGLSALAVGTRREDGATAVEYALMLALIAVVIVAAVTLLGQATSESFSDAAAGFGP
jgi:pilus assembly protein Flp/PilA